MAKPSRRRTTETGGPDHRVTTTSSAKVKLSWRVRVAARVLTEDVSRIGRDTYERAKKAIQKKLTLGAQQYGERLHSPLHGLYKLKSSNISLAYRIDVATREVWVLLIGDRQTSGMYAKARFWTASSSSGIRLRCIARNETLPQEAYRNRRSGSDHTPH